MNFSYQIRDHVMNIGMISRDTDSVYDDRDSDGVWVVDVDTRTRIAYTYYVKWFTFKMGDDQVAE